MGDVRQAAVAGFFYPEAPEALAAGVRDYLEAAPSAPAGAVRPKAIIVPHAGYVYSGTVAARAYARVAAAGPAVRRVVLFGPAHRVPLRGLALPAVAAFETPLGRVPVATQAAAAASRLPQVCTSDAAHAREHSLEVQLPFLQTVLGSFDIVPFAVGDATTDEVAEVVDLLWGGPETLIVVSSDLSHYQRYADASEADRATARVVLALAGTLRHEQACGATPINGLLTAARCRGLRAELLDLRNSGDATGDRARVVGYAAFAFSEAACASDPDLGRALLTIARSAIAVELGLPGCAADPGASEALQRHAATFVTLRQSGRLRGCVGSLRPKRPLGVDVRENAIAAASRDPRFPPLAASELETTLVEVSLLSEEEPIEAATEKDLVARLRPGIDGLILGDAGRRATLLPQVWETVADPREFVAALKRKAGLPAGTWGPSLKFSRYQVTHWQEQDSASVASSR